MILQGEQRRKSFSDLDTNQVGDGTVWPPGMAHAGWCRPSGSICALNAHNTVTACWCWSVAEHAWHVAEWRRMASSPAATCSRQLVSWTSPTSLRRRTPTGMAR